LREAIDELEFQFDHTMSVRRDRLLAAMKYCRLSRVPHVP